MATTYNNLYMDIRQTLRRAGIEAATLEARELMCFASGKTRSQLVQDGQLYVPPAIEERAKDLVRRHLAGEPVAYLIGEWEFYGLTLDICRDVLIPRADTETLVEEALKVVKPGMKVLDMCTGSGCVLISILKNVHGTGGYGYDISKQAINVAKENAKLNDVPAIFERSNLFEDVADETFDVIVSNPPYIRSDEIPFLMPEVSEFEPHEALDGKEDGLFFYRKIIQESPDYLTDGGYLLFEIGYDQGWAVSSMMKEAGFEDVCVKKDLARNDRVVCGHKHLCEKRG